MAKTRRGKRGVDKGGDIVTAMLTIRNQIKIYHWQTASFARHNATDDLTESLDKRIDEFVEVYMGKYGRPQVTGTIKVGNISESAAKTFVAKQTEYLTKTLPKQLSSDDVDLLAIRDEILADLHKTLYLFTLS